MSDSPIELMEPQTKNEVIKLELRYHGPMPSDSWLYYFDDWAEHVLVQSTNNTAIVPASITLVR